ncbi:hypothetical protein BAUCODRAFT_403078 [Baudoinia panamericana UAMH 10762]|uniref:Uncharacterized protein n=1 Tax=Baudoinia panamericana (strain UAMH 10762) TaxID=717646 RepID=M2LTA1_BAUPA|nr:uncharacterized protein BAUCODRAFT_403078 [Baudoinia panamericana UAMH 10762]EMC97757.1 hypothetical protein BAUCODRAFT_403078 [Baudoinia panamericana UAMH 10762]
MRFPQANQALTPHGYQLQTSHADYTVGPQVDHAQFTYRGRSPQDQYNQAPQGHHDHQYLRGVHAQPPPFPSATSASLQPGQPTPPTVARLREQLSSSPAGYVAGPQHASPLSDHDQGSSAFTPPPSRGTSLPSTVARRLKDEPAGLNKPTEPHPLLGSYLKQDRGLLAHFAKSTQVNQPRKQTDTCLVQCGVPLDRQCEVKEVYYMGTIKKWKGKRERTRGSLRLGQRQSPQRAGFHKRQDPFRGPPAPGEILRRREVSSYVEQPGPMR